MTDTRILHVYINCIYYNYMTTMFNNRGAVREYGSVRTVVRLRGPLDQRQLLDRGGNAMFAAVERQAG